MYAMLSRRTNEKHLPDVFDQRVLRHIKEFGGATDVP